ncbi:MAG: RNA 2',3'-cyclic phosphodiesterase [Planctomycetota bacterium]
MNKVRTFIAIALTDEVRNNLLSIQHRLSETGTKIRWVEHKNLHLTLKFLGDIYLSNAGDISQIIEKAVAGVKPFVFEISGTGAFPNLHSPRIVWVGVKKNVDILANIFNYLNEHLLEYDIPPENRSYVPHITIGRVKSMSHSGSGNLELRIKENSEKVFGEVEVKEILLMMSELSPAGPKYTVLSAVRLPWTNTE